jgi:hypothetical protein
VLLDFELEEFNRLSVVNSTRALKACPKVSSGAFNRLQFLRICDDWIDGAIPWTEFRFGVSAEEFLYASDFTAAEWTIALRICGRPRPAARSPAVETPEMPIDTHGSWPAGGRPGDQQHRGPTISRFHARSNI